MGLDSVRFCLVFFFGICYTLSLPPLDDNMGLDSVRFFFFFIFFGVFIQYLSYIAKNLILTWILSFRCSAVILVGVSCM